MKQQRVGGKDGAGGGRGVGNERGSSPTAGRRIIGVNPQYAWACGLGGFVSSSPWACFSPAATLAFSMEL